MVKDGKNTHSNYNFASYDGIMTTLRPYFNREGIRTKFSERSRTMTFDLKTSSGKSAIGAEIVLDLYVIDIETGEFDVSECSGFSTDTQDKALSQANTLAKKYGLFAVFEISTSGGANSGSDDPDNHSPLADGPPPNARQNGNQGGNRGGQQRGAQAAQTSQNDPSKPIPGPMVTQIRRVVERMQKAGFDITEQKVVTKHAAGKENLEGCTFEQGRIMSAALEKYEKSEQKKARQASAQG